MAGTIRRVWKAPPPKLDSAPLSEIGDTSSPRDNEDNALENNISASASDVTMSAENLQAIQQQIADFQAAVQQNPCRRC